MAEPASPIQRWQAYFQRAAEPVFLLNRHRRVLFVNVAWEKLTGVPAAHARGLLCGRRRGEAAEPLAELAPLLAPPEAVLNGQTGQVRRRGPVAGGKREFWDIDFFPLLDEQGVLCVLGKIRVLPAAEVPGGLLLPEGILDLDARANRRYRLDTLTSERAVQRRVAEQVRLASQVRTPVLIVGEPGTGKRWVARTIHATSGTAGGFALVDGAGLPPIALARLLTSADGLLHRPGMGTIYVREPASLPRDIQSALVAWLEQERQRSTCPRLVAGCRIEPDVEGQAGRLIEELYCALSPLVIQLLPLRERQADLPDLVERLLERLREDGGRRMVGLTAAAWDVLRSYAWPGNVRELYAVLATARKQAAGDRLDRGDLPAYLRLAATGEPGPASESNRPLPLDAFLERAEKRLIELALRKARSNKSRAAELLAIWRPRLLRRMEALGLTPAQKPASSRDEPVEIEEILEEPPT